MAMRNLCWKCTQLMWCTYIKTYLYIYIISYVFAYAETKRRITMQLQSIWFFLTFYSYNYYYLHIVNNSLPIQMFIRSSPYFYCWFGFAFELTFFTVFHNILSVTELSKCLFLYILVCTYWWLSNDNIGKCFDSTLSIGIGKWILPYLLDI